MFESKTGLYSSPDSTSPYHTDQAPKMANLMHLKSKEAYPQCGKTILSPKCWINAIEWEIDWRFREHLNILCSLRMPQWKEVCYTLITKQDHPMDSHLPSFQASWHKKNPGTFQSNLLVCFLGKGCQWKCLYLFCMCTSQSSAIGEPTKTMVSRFHRFFFNWPTRFRRKFYHNDDHWQIFKSHHTVTLISTNNSF